MNRTEWKTERLLEARAGLLAERATIVRIPDELGPSWTGRDALKELARIVSLEGAP